MLTKQEKQKIERQVDDLQKEITTIRGRLTELNDQRQAVFTKRKDIGKQGLSY